jgi:hypothetical protein
MIVKLPPLSLPILMLFGALCAKGAHAGELRVSTDFEGGSARVESIDQVTRSIRVMPGGDPARGWPCWWYFRIDGVSEGENLKLELAGSDLPSRDNGKSTGKPLSPSWAMPGRAAFSTDGEVWRHTKPGRRSEGRMTYEIAAESDHLYVAWGPPFTPRHAAALLAMAKKATSSARSFELCRSREGRPVLALRISEAKGPKPFGVWVEARQHAWESGSSWVAQGFVEWLISADEAAKWLRQNAEIYLVPIVDVDNVATGNGGKEAAPHDYNRDWSDQPIYPEVAAAQKHLRQLAAEGRLDLFVNLHNPSPADLRPFFFCGPIELLSPAGQRNRATFLQKAFEFIHAPLALEEKPRTTGPNFHPLWRQISGQWVTDHGNLHTVSACLETPWNTPHSTSDGYQTVGRQLGEAITGYLRTNPRASTEPEK